MPYRLFYVPIATAWLCVVSLYAANSYKTPINDIWIPLVVCGSFAVLLLGLYLIPTQTRKAAPLLASITTILLLMWMEFPDPIIPAFAIIGGIVLLYKAEKDVIHRITKAVGLIALFGVVASGAMAFIDKSEPEVVTIKSNYELTETPDIYFIIPDRMPSIESMIESGFDTSEFVSELESLGFYIDSDAMSIDPVLPGSAGVPTSRTLRFLTSVLNLGYDVPLEIPFNVADNMVKGNQMIDVMKANGYSYYHSGSWFEPSAYNMNADVNYIYKGEFIANFFYDSQFSTAVIDRSILRYANLLVGNRIQEEYNRAVFQAESVKSTAQYDSPKFVFAHILVPHPEYVFKPDGSKQDEGVSDTDAYYQQIEYAMIYLVDIVKALPEDAIVIVQSDEGMLYDNHDYNDSLSLTQWNGILTAWRVPGNPEGVRSVDILKYVLEQLS